MQRVMFAGNNQYKPSIEPTRDNLFIPHNYFSYE